jgi:hypothetical protein
MAHYRDGLGIITCRWCIGVSDERMQPPENPSEHRDRGRVVGKTHASRTYHFLINNRSESLCGLLNDEEFFGPDIALTLTKSEAEQHEFVLCGHCARLVDG